MCFCMFFENTQKRHQKRMFLHVFRKMQKHIVFKGFLGGGRKCVNTTIFADPGTSGLRGTTTNERLSNVSALN